MSCINCNSVKKQISLKYVNGIQYKFCSDLCQSAFIYDNHIKKFDIDMKPDKKHFICDGNCCLYRLRSRKVKGITRRLVADCFE